MDTLVSIDLSQNAFTSIPEELALLKNLKQIRLQNCKLKTLPMSMLSLASLQSLDFNNNSLTSFYDGQVTRQDIELPNLSYLSLNGNQLTQIPSILKYLPKLQQLHLHMNRISDVKELCRKQFSKLEIVKPLKLH